MEIRHLIYFAKVAELESLTHAAEALNVTQPALGMQIRKLEEYLEVDLIERHSRGVRLTEAGHALNRHAVRIIEGFNEAKADVRRFGKDAIGNVRIGVTPSMGRIVVPLLLQHCADQYPTLSLHLTQGFTDQLQAAILARELDFAVTALPLESEIHESLPLYVETFLLVGRPDIMPVGEGPVTLTELSQMPLALDGRSLLLRQKLDAALAREGLEFTNVQDIEAISLRRELVLQGRRAAVATQALFHQEIEHGQVVARPIALSELSWELNLTTHRVERMSKAEAAIRKLLISIVDETIASDAVGWRMPGSS